MIVPVMVYVLYLLFYSYRLHTSNIDLKYGEFTFNSLLLYPFIEAVADFVSENMAWSKAGFRNGKAPLVSMHKQLENTELYQNDNYNYFADGIIKLYGLKKNRGSSFGDFWQFWEH